MKLILFLTMILVLTSCQDQMRSRRPTLEQNQEALNAGDEEKAVTVQVDVDYSSKDGKIEFLTNDEDGQEDCQIVMRTGRILKYKIRNNVLTLYENGASISFERQSETNDNLKGVWINKRNTRLISIEEKLFFNSDERLVIRKVCTKL